MRQIEIAFKWFIRFVIFDVVWKISFVEPISYLEVERVSQSLPLNFRYTTIMLKTLSVGLN